MIVMVASMGLWSLVRSQEVPERTTVKALARHEVAELFHQITLHAATGTPLGRLTARAAATGWTIDDQGTRWLVTRQVPDGAGVYAFRVGALPAEMVLQAPHPFYDLGTGALVAKIFDEYPVRVACFATANRKRPGNDVAHVASTRFQSATQGIVDALAAPVLVQLHGFGSRTTSHDAVLSSGPLPVKSGVVVRRAKRMASQLGWQVATGADVPQLAGRTNLQARLLRGPARFVHVELSRDARKQLMERPPQLNAFVDVLPWRPEDVW